MKLLLLMLALTVTGFAETHRFEPTDFYNTFSGAHTPVLRIKPGDHVVTFTIDARGVDSEGAQRGRDRIPRPARSTSKAPSQATLSSFISCGWRPTAPRVIPHRCLPPTPPIPAFYARMRCESRKRQPGRSTSKKASPIPTG